jgi:hypothetical protein
MRPFSFHACHRRQSCPASAPSAGFPALRWCAIAVETRTLLRRITGTCGPSATVLLAARQETLCLTRCSGLWVVDKISVRQDSVCHRRTARVCHHHGRWPGRFSSCASSYLLLLRFFRTMAWGGVIGERHGPDHDSVRSQVWALNLSL